MSGLSKWLRPVNWPPCPSPQGLNSFTSRSERFPATARGNGETDPCCYAADAEQADEQPDVIHESYLLGAYPIVR